MENESFDSIFTWAFRLLRLFWAETLKEKDSKNGINKNVCEFADEFTCIPMMAYMKNNIAISKQTYGSALKDWTKVQSKILIV